MPPPSQLATDRPVPDVRAPDVRAPDVRAPGEHIPALDGARGLAVLMVLAHNFNVIGGALSAPANAVGLLMDLGWVGVQLFFVLSGFLITGILLESRDADNYYRAFLGRRALRIFPLYYAVLLVAFVVVPLVAGTRIAGHEHQIWLWTYTANWAEPYGLGVALFPHFWSLAIEEQFYLAWPLIVRWLSPRRLFHLCLGLIVIAFASRLALRLAGAGSAGPYMFTVCRVDALAIGAIAALLVRSPRAAAAFVRRRRAIRWSALAIVAVAVVLMRGAPRTSFPTQTYGYTVFALGFAVLVLDLALAPARRPDWPSRILAFAPLRAVGRYSYAMYVFHTPLHLLIGLPLIADLGGGEVGAGLGLLYAALATIATFVAAVLSYHLLEKHFLRLKRRFVAAPAEAV
jgi:peptidoglycan/LPS O-acetylase OafA/YrhL